MRYLMMSLACQPGSRGGGGGQLPLPLHAGRGVAELGHGASSSSSSHPAAFLSSGVALTAGVPSLYQGAPVPARRLSSSGGVLGGAPSLQQLQSRSVQLRSQPLDMPTSPSDVRFGSDLRKAALMRSIMMRSEVRLRTPPHTSHNSPSPTPPHTYRQARLRVLHCAVLYCNMKVADAGTLVGSVAGLGPAGKQHHHHHEQQHQYTTASASTHDMEFMVGWMAQQKPDGDSWLKAVIPHLSVWGGSLIVCGGGGE